jgi:sulfur carrier protein
MADAQGIHVLVNGADVSVPTGSTLAELLRRLSLEGRPVAVEHNRHVVPRAEHAAVRLNHGDTVEIVTFVGGG